MINPVLPNPSLAHQARTQLENLIAGGTLRPGDQLPSEKELCQMLGVSRTVVREAIRELSAKGLVEVRAGSGSYVRPLGANLIKGPVDLLLRARALNAEDIHEVRAALEVHIAGLAAQRRDAAELEAMEQAIRALKKPRLSAMEYAAADVAFHNALAEAAHSPLLLVLVGSLSDLMIELRLRVFAQGHVPDTAIFHHSRILHGVKARDSEGARKAMTEHLAQSLEVLQQVWPTARDTISEPA